MADNNIVIRLSGIQFSYPGQAELFKGLRVEVARGERLAIVGATGSGKTTLFRIMMCLNKPSAGSIELDGRLVRNSEDIAFARRKVGFLFQHSDDQLFCPTVGEDVAFGPLNLGRSREDAEKRVSDVLESLGLSGYADRVTYRLSGGEKRLAALAAVLAMEPEVLLLDEPTTSLDPRTKRILVSLLKKIPATQVIASHDMEFVRATCERVMVMHQGKFLARGLTDEILSNDELMLLSGLEVPYSLEELRHPPHDHHHGAGPSHGHGHTLGHEGRQHRNSPPD